MNIAYWNRCIPDFPDIHIYIQRCAESKIHRQWRPIASVHFLCMLSLTFVRLCSSCANAYRSPVGTSVVCALLFVWSGHERCYLPFSAILLCVFIDDIGKWKFLSEFITFHFLFVLILIVFAHFHLNSLSQFHRIFFCLGNSRWIFILRFILEKRERLFHL